MATHRRALALLTGLARRQQHGGAYSLNARGMASQQGGPSDGEAVDFGEQCTHGRRLHTRSM
jgi:hypothetical protein